MLFKLILSGSKIRKNTIFVVSNLIYKNYGRTKSGYSKLPASHIPIIRDRLLEMDESKLIYLQTCDFKDPTIILIISVFLGSLGIDRFLIGDVALGVGKLVTLGGCGIWMIIDWFLIMDATKKKNLEQLQNILMF